MIIDRYTHKCSLGKIEIPDICRWYFISNYTILFPVQSIHSIDILTGYEPQQDHQRIYERPEDERGYVKTLWFKLGGLQDETRTRPQNERFEVCFRLETGRKGRDPSTGIR